MKVKITSIEIANYFDITPQTLFIWQKSDNGKVELYKAAIHWIAAKDVNFKQVVHDLDTISLLNDMGSKHKSVEKRL